MGGIFWLGSRLEYSRCSSGRHCVTGPQWTIHGYCLTNHFPCHQWRVQTISRFPRERCFHFVYRGQTMGESGGHSFLEVSVVNVHVGHIFLLQIVSNIEENAQQNDGGLRYSCLGIIHNICNGDYYDWRSTGTAPGVRH
uniref:Uncharacterized protein n=1 Tax=Cacopsylla melanoneura TaxID=428564 RepID=A0A8D9B5W1_9HEMI